MKILKLSNGVKIRIEEYEVQDVLSGVAGKETKIFKHGMANLIYFVALVEESDEMYDRKLQTTGILHDGTPVIRYFGQWYTNGVFDEKGNPIQRIDPTYYQEVNRDCVFSPKSMTK